MAKSRSPGEYTLNDFVVSIFDYMSTKHTSPVSPESPGESARPEFRGLSATHSKYDLIYSLSGKLPPLYVATAARFPRRKPPTAGHLQTPYSLRALDHPLSHALNSLTDAIDEHGFGHRIRIETFAANETRKVGEGLVGEDEQQLHVSWMRAPLEDVQIDRINGFYQQGASANETPTKTTERIGYFLKKLGGHVLIENYHVLEEFGVRNVVTLPLHVEYP